MHSSSPPSSWPWRPPTPAPTAPPSSPPLQLDSPQKRALLLSRLFWWVDSAQVLKTRLNARLPSLDSGLGLLLFSGQATGTPQPNGCALIYVQPLRILS